jgi:hypothetical protein
MMLLEEKGMMKAVGGSVVVLEGAGVTLLVAMK